MNLYKDIIRAVTPQAKIDYQIFIINTGVENLVKYEMVEHFSALCKQGCANFMCKWSCPPYAPFYHEFVKKYSNISVCLSLVQTDQFDYIKNDYLKIKAANSILKSRIDKTLRKLIDEDIYYISTGSCRLCKSCKCKINEPCANPKLMSYSFEALGINVSDMVNDIFGIPLLWYKKNNLPKYTCVVAGLLYNDEFDANKIIEILRNMN